MPKIAALAAVAGLAACAAGCSTFKTDAGRSLETTGKWSTPSAFTTASVRMVTQRDHPVLGNPIVCSEPPPDIALAVSKQTALNASGGNGAVTASLGAQSSSAEAAAELAGRTTALIGLRDGLFRACEAYANGSLGQDAYALIVSRYGQLMSTLFLAQDIASATGAQGKATATATALQALGAQGNGQPTPSQPKPKTSGDSGSGNSSDKSSDKSPGGGSKMDYDGTLISPLLVGYAGSDPPAKLTLVAQNAPAGTAKGGAKTPVKKAKVPPATGDGTASTPEDTSKNSKTAGAGDPSATPALALTRMNEDYIHQGFLDLIFVSCINEGDPTRHRLKVESGHTEKDGGGTTDAGEANSGKTTAGETGGGGAGGGNTAQAVDGRKPIKIDYNSSYEYNPWLREVCDMLANRLSQTDFLSLGANGFTFVDPAPPSSAAAGAVAPAGDATMKAIQTALKARGCTGCDPGRADGIFDPATYAAVAAFQKAQDIKPDNGVGNPYDGKTLVALLTQQPAKSTPPAAAPGAAAPAPRADHKPAGHAAAKPSPPKT